MFELRSSVSVLGCVTVRVRTAAVRWVRSLISGHWDGKAWNPPGRLSLLEGWNGRNWKETVW